MAKINKLASTTNSAKPKVCAYVRVSTSKLEQLNSFEEQLRYWNDRFSEDDSIEYIGMYSDEGISGSSIEKRHGFNEVLSLAIEGKVDIVYTKSLTRFSRNMVESLDSIELLRECSVKVIFEKEGIDSFDTGSRFILNILTRIAEEDVNSISQNIIMATRSKIARGKVLVPKVYGYVCTYNKQSREYDLVINPEQAEVVRTIFDLYIKGYGLGKIAQHLDNNKVLTAMNMGKWSQATIRRMLSNEKYVGDTIMQKEYLHNGKMVTNNNENPSAPLVVIENTHEPIISRDVFNKVKIIKSQRTINTNQHMTTPKYAFRSKIVCGDCGAGFRHKNAYYKGVLKNEFWGCYNKQNRGHLKLCNNHSVKDEVLKVLFSESYVDCINANHGECNIQELLNRREVLRINEQELNKMHAKGFVSLEMYSSDLREIVAERDSVQEKISLERKRQCEVQPLQKGETMDDAIIKYLDKVVVYDWTITFVFINGYETTRRYNNDNTKNSNRNTIED